MITRIDILNDFLITIPLFIWVMFVIKYFSRWIYNFAVKKGYSPASATYFGRKIVHIFAPGIVAVLIPFFFKAPFLPFLAGIVLTIYTYALHKNEKLQEWFQVKGNLYEVNFAFMWGLVILIGWFFDKTFWLGVIPALFMSFGDGVSGIVRNFKYRRRVKAWEGSLAMLICCSLIGGLKFGLPGILAALFATIFEKLEFIDDNISIPIISFLTLLIFK